MIRLFDFFASLVGLLLFLPIFPVLAMLILLDSGFPIFYVQERIGKNGLGFKLIKFRTMRSDPKNGSLLTIGSKDNRITKVGYFLRKFKLDEMPQLINVFKGEMSFVGPRPEVRKYVEMYNEIQKKVLQVRPGITDLASLEYIDEDALLGKSTDPEKTYIEEIMPHKLELNLKYLETRTLRSDIGVILKTLYRIVS